MLAGTDNNIKQTLIAAISVLAMFIGLIGSKVMFSEKNVKIEKKIERESEQENKKLERLLVVNNNLFDEKGKPVYLVGVTTDEFRFNPVHLKAETLKINLSEVKSWGVNMVVLYLQQPVYVDKRIDEIVELANWATENQMYTMVFPVVHQDDSIPERDKWRKIEDIQYSPMGKNTENILDKLSDKLRDNKGVIYGMGAEHHGVPQEALYKRQLEMIDVVRKNSPQSVVVINGMEYGRFLHMYIASPPPQPNILYDLHQYVTAKEADIDINKCTVPTEYIGRLPFILGEFGGAYSEGFGSYNDLDCVNSFIYSSKKANIGFVVHTIDYTSRMGLFSQNGQVTSKGKLLKKALKEFATEKQD